MFVDSGAAGTKCGKMEIETLQSGDLLKNHNAHLDNMENEDDWEGGDNSAKLFERSRIKALAGRNVHDV